MKKTFTVVYSGQPYRNRTFKVRGVCQFDVLNPCWDNRSTDIAGKHWGDKDVASCSACAEAAASSRCVALVGEQ